MSRGSTSTADRGLRRLFQQASARRRFGPETTAYRLFNGEAEGLPEVTVDWFDRVAILSLYREHSSREEEALADALWEAVQPRAVYLKRRPRQARQVAQDLERVAPPRPLRGEEVESLPVLENGLAFEIRPPNGLSVGLYLDARDARSWVRAHSRGLSLLNCFAYTCGFGIAARAGGSSRALDLDLSRRVLEWGERNASLNGLSVEREEFLAGEVFHWLGRFRKKGERFDLVVLDPPSFATTKQSRFSAATGYAALVELAAPVLAPHGTLLACCNLASLDAASFQAMVQEGLRRAGRRGRVRERLSASSVDFPTRGEGPLKVLVVEMLSAT